MAGDNTGRPVEGAHPPGKGKKGLFLTLGVLVAVALVGFAVASLMRKPVTETKVSNAKGTPIVDAPVKLPAATPVTQRPTVEIKTEKKEVPPEVIRYLAHLKQVELYRQGVEAEFKRQLTRQIAEAAKGALGGLTADDVDALANGNFEVLKKHADAASTTSALITDLYQKITKWFNSVSPPDDCRQLANNYGAALSQIASKASQIGSGIGSLDLSGVQELKGKTGSIDDDLRSARDDLVAVRKKYGLPADFDIDVDGGGSLLETRTGL